MIDTIVYHLEDRNVVSPGAHINCVQLVSLSPQLLGPLATWMLRLVYGFDNALHMVKSRV